MLSDSDSQFEEAMAMVHAQNKMKKAGMPENATSYRDVRSESDFINKA